MCLAGLEIPLSNAAIRLSRQEILHPWQETLHPRQETLHPRQEILHPRQERLHAPTREALSWIKARFDSCRCGDAPRRFRVPARALRGAKYRNATQTT
jgi:hypothetical protein